MAYCTLNCNNTNLAWEFSIAKTRRKEITRILQYSLFVGEHVVPEEAREYILLRARDKLLN